MQLYTKENNTLYFSRQYKDKGAKVNFITVKLFIVEHRKILRKNVN